MGQITDSGARVNWGPYANQTDALLCLGRFTDKALGSDVGILWSDGAACILLRRPALDGDGFGQSLIVEWLGPMPPPPPSAPPTAWQRIKHVFEKAMEYEIQGQLMQAEAQQAEADAMISSFRSIGDWLSKKDNEHAVALAFDVLGVIGFALLFVPGVGEVEMGVVAAVRAGQILAAAGRVTAASAFVGASLGAYVDGKYLYLRHFSGDQTAVRQARAKEWDEDPQAVTMSLASAILSLPDFAVGGILTVRSLRELPTALRETRAAATELRAGAAVKDAKAGQLLERAETAPDWHARKLEQKAADVSARAERLAKRAKAAEERGQRLSRKLAAIMSVGVPGSAGVPVTIAYYLRDNAADEADPFRVARKYLRDLLEPPYCKASAQGGAGQNLAMRIGTTSRSSSDGR